jgi:hypothetical protein
MTGADLEQISKRAWCSYAVRQEGKRSTAWRVLLWLLLGACTVKASVPYRAPCFIPESLTVPLKAPWRHARVLVYKMLQEAPQSETS